MIGGALSSACLTFIHSRKIPLSCFAIALHPQVSPEIPRTKGISLAARPFERPVQSPERTKDRRHRESGQAWQHGLSGASTKGLQSWHSVTHKVFVTQHLDMQGNPS